MKAVWASVFVACVAWACGTAAGAEWVERVRQEIAAEPARPRRVMVVFPLVEEGSDTGEVGWGRGLIAIQAMWRSSFVPERLLDTYDYRVAGYFADQQLLGPGRTVTEDKIQDVLAAMGVDGYVTGTLGLSELVYRAHVTLHGTRGDVVKDYTGATDAIHRLPCLIARDVVDYLQVSVTEQQAAALSEPLLCSAELMDEVRRWVHTCWYLDQEFPGFWQRCLRECRTPWTEYMRLASLTPAEVLEVAGSDDPVRERSAGSDFLVAQALFQRADAGRGSYGDAGEALVPLMRSDPYAPVLVYYVASSLGGIGEDGLALGVLAWAVRLHNGGVQGLLSRGEGLRRYAGDTGQIHWPMRSEAPGRPAYGKMLDAARRDLADVLADEPRCWPAARLLISMPEGPPAPAARIAFDRAVSICPTDRDAYCAMRDIFLRHPEEMREELLRFGRHCVATGLYQASIPVLLYECHADEPLRRGRTDNLYGGSREALREDYFTQPHVWQEVRPVLVGAARADDYDVVSTARCLRYAYANADAELVSEMMILHRERMSRLAGYNPTGADQVPDGLEALAEAGWPELHVAAAYGHGDRLRELIEGGADPAEALPGGWTPVHFAADRNRSGALRVLIDAGVALDPRTDEGETPVYCAVRAGRADAALMLAEAGADLSAADAEGRTSLYAAVLNGDAATTTLLLEHGADPDRPARAGNTPLYTAVLRPRSGVIEALLAAGADPNRATVGGDTPLNRAALGGGLGAVRLLLAGGGDPNLLDGDGFGPLHCAASKGHDEVVEALLSGGADPDLPNHKGYTAVCWAARHGTERVAAVLLRAGADPDGGAQTPARPLYTAVRWGHIRLARMLLDAGADTEAIGVGGQWLPLQLAAERNNADMVRLLVEHGADLNAALAGGWTPLHIAAYEGNADAARALVAAGADTEARLDDGRSPLDLARRIPDAAMESILLGEGLPGRADLGALTLVGAVLANDLAAAERLLAEGADVNAVSGEGRVTALHLAAGRGQADMVRLFLQREADVTLTDDDGCTALYDAARAGVTGVVQLLLDAGADPNCASRYGTALHAAADADRRDVARQLLEAGARSEATDAWGRTPLIAAAWNGHEQTVRLLAEAGARLDARADVWHTALHVAARAGHADAVKVLLELGATPGPRDKEAETPLHFAAAAGSLSCAQALVDAGAEVNCLNSRAHTPLREARDNGHDDVARYLEAHGGRDSAPTGEGGPPNHEARSSGSPAGGDT